MTATLWLGTLVLPDHLLPGGGALAVDGRLQVVAEDGTALAASRPELEPTLVEGYVCPGFVDLHVHGGDGSDFMDATPEAFRTVAAAHLRHGTTGLVPTTTVADRERLLDVLAITRAEAGSLAAPRVLGAHFYGPYFGEAAVGCHPPASLRSPASEAFADYLDFSDILVSATVAPELPGAEPFVRACRERGIVANIGHSHATFEQVEAAVGWGARHVDHLFCAMSDRARLRQSQAYPMRGGVLEATLYFDELTTEVIADGKHLTRDLLLLAYKLKGPDRLALVTDCNRALDLPDGEYLFGPAEGGEPFRKRDGVGVTLDGSALASSAQGMDHMVRTFHQLTGVALPEVVRMASRTPAQIIGWDDRVGSLEVGKLADVVALDRALHVQQVWVGGRSVWSRT